MKADTCAGCGECPGPFTCMLSGKQVPLCAKCAGRLMQGTPREEVIKPAVSANEASGA